MAIQCEKCGSARVEAAQLEGMAIRLERASTMKKIFNVGGVVSCQVCIDCGAVFDLRGDPEKLAAMCE
jgi:hypothetical protein